MGVPEPLRASSGVGRREQDNADRDPINASGAGPGAGAGAGAKPATLIVVFMLLIAEIYIPARLTRAVPTVCVSIQLRYRLHVTVPLRLLMFRPVGRLVTALVYV